MESNAVNHSQGEFAAFFGGMKEDLAKLKKILGDELRDLQFAVEGLGKHVGGTPIEVFPTSNRSLLTPQHGESVRTGWEDSEGNETKTGEVLESEPRALGGHGDSLMETGKGTGRKVPCMPYKGTWTSACLTIQHDVGDWTTALYCVGPYKVSKQPSLTTLKVAEYMFDGNLDEKVRGSN